MTTSPTAPPRATRLLDALPANRKLKARRACSRAPRDVYGRIGREDPSTHRGPLVRDRRHGRKASRRRSRAAGQLDYEPSSRWGTRSPSSSRRAHRPSRLRFSTMPSQQLRLRGGNSALRCARLTPGAGSLGVRFVGASAPITEGGSAASRGRQRQAPRRLRNMSQGSHLPRPTTAAAGLFPREPDGARISPTLQRIVNVTRVRPCRGDRRASAGSTGCCAAQGTGTTCASLRPARILLIFDEVITVSGARARASRAPLRRHPRPNHRRQGPHNATSRWCGAAQKHV